MGGMRENWGAEFGGNGGIGGKGGGGAYTKRGETGNFMHKVVHIGTRWLKEVDSPLLVRSKTQKSCPQPLPPPYMWYYGG